MTPPYSFGQPAYRRCFLSPREAMDRRHIWMLHGVLAAGRFQETLELGCFWGASSTAFVEAVNAGQVARATFCDTDPTAGLCDVLESGRYPERLRFTRQPSWEVLESADPFDLILVDANHDLDSVGMELLRLLPRRPRCLLAHDTHAMAAGYAKCEGSALLKAVFTALPGYYCLEDCRARESEETERGLFLATTSLELYQRARRVFAAYGADLPDETSESAARCGTCGGSINTCFVRDCPRTWPATDGADELALENWPTALETRVLVRS